MNFLRDPSSKIKCQNENKSFQARPSRRFSQILTAPQLSWPDALEIRGAAVVTDFKSSD
jgi:hypothetical protein